MIKELFGRLKLLREEKKRDIEIMKEYELWRDEEPVIKKKIEKRRPKKGQVFTEEEIKKKEDAIYDYYNERWNDFVSFKNGKVSDWFMKYYCNWSIKITKEHFDWVYH